METFTTSTLSSRYTLEYGLGAQDGVKRPFLQVEDQIKVHQTFQMRPKYFSFWLFPQTSMFSQGRMNTNIKYNITSKRWELRHLHSPNYALLTDKRATSEDVYPIGRWFISSRIMQWLGYSWCLILINITDDKMFRYKWRVYNPECDTIDTEIFLTLSRYYNHHHLQ